MSDTEPQIVGWKVYYWRKPARRCSRCNRKARKGTIGLAQLGREREEDFRFICDVCMAEIEDHVEEGS